MIQSIAVMPARSLACARVSARSVHCAVEDQNVTSIDRSTPAARRRLAIRVLAALAGFAFLVGLVVGATTVSSQERVSKAFVRAWERGDYGGMYAMLTPGARKRVSASTFRAAYDTAAATATAVGVAPRKVHGDGRVEMT